MVTILKGAVSSLTQAPRQEVGHIWAPLIRLTKSHFISLVPSVGNEIFRFIFEDLVSINFLLPDEVQSRFRSLGPAGLGPCGHH